MKKIPSAAAVRPAQCPCCSAPGAPIGKRVVIQGHGLRSRLLRGPLSIDGDSVEVTVWTRRYLCRRCDTVLMVVPQGVLRSHLFSAQAIGLALTLWAVHRVPAHKVRKCVSPWKKVGSTAAAGWASLRRWVKEAPRLFAGLRPCPEHWSLRRRAERIAMMLTACAHRLDGAVLERAFEGAPRACD